MDISWVGIPPIKCQGIKSKLVPFIFRNIRWDDRFGGRWIEPFVGSGVVALNLAPQRALLADTNVHIISLYCAIQRGDVTAATVREHLVREGKILERLGAEHYYAIRDRFNASGDHLDFLFLNRSCFNGVMRFNRHGGFNVPFGHKPQRFSPAYITNVCNQVSWVARQMRGKDWTFAAMDWRTTLADVSVDDFVYLDPPYVGRHADYFTQWDAVAAKELAASVRRLSCGFALSMWKENRYRRNEHLDAEWTSFEIRTFDHFYHVGSMEELRNAVREALVIRPDFATPAASDRRPSEITAIEQLGLSLP